MKITAVETLLCRLPVVHREGIPRLAGVPRKDFEMLLVRISTDTGLVGWGESFAHYGTASTVKLAIEQLLAPRCLGEDPRTLHRLVDKLEQDLYRIGRTGPIAHALSGVEIALWDLVGKSLNVSVHQLLGGARAESLRCYASLPRYGSQDAVVHDCKTALARGFDAIKIHEIGVDELRACGAFMAANPGIDYMIDANCPWSLEEALHVCEILRAGPAVKWLEEPLTGPDDYRSLAQLRRRGGVPVAAGENANEVHDFALMRQAEAVDFAQPSVAKLGGIGALLRVIDLLRDTPIQFAPHTPFLGPALIAALHVCAARAPDTSVECYFLDTPGNPFGAWTHPQRGRLRVPDGPGLGADPDPELLQAVLARD